MNESFAGEWEFVDGVGTATYVLPVDDSVSRTIKTKKSGLSLKEISSGSAAGIVPGDTAFVTWPASGTVAGVTTAITVAQGGTLTWAGTTYKIVATEERSDGAQVRAICRRQI